MTSADTDLAIEAGTVTPPVAPDEVEAFGYRQHFVRTLRPFTSFAIAVSTTSVTVGIFATYAFVLATGGPAGIWMWPVAIVGLMMVALVCSQLASHIPLAGFTYQWASRLVDPRVGWIFGWLYFVTWAFGVVSVDYALATQVMVPLFNMSTSTGTSEAITLIALGVQAILLIISTRVASLFNAAAVATELIGMAVLAIALVIVAIVHGNGDIGNLTNTGAVSHHGYFKLNGPFMLCLLLAVYTVGGFEAPSNLSEETKDAVHVVPKAIWRSVLTSGLVGFGFLLALTVAIPDLKKVSASASPVATVMQLQLGETVEKIFLAFVMFSFLSCGLVIMALCSRIVFAMGRDQRFPGYQLVGRVSDRWHTPAWATALVFVVSSALFLAFVGSPTTLNNLIAANSVFPAIIYVATVVMYLCVRHRLPKHSGTFDLGRFAVPVSVIALIWLAVELTALIFPSMFWAPIRLASLLVAIGALVFLVLLIVKPRAMCVQAGEDT